MTQSEHTPGPWHWFTHNPGIRYQEYSTLQNLEGTQICDDGSACAEYGAVIDVSGPDAKLIEQAPELLEALECLLDKCPAHSADYEHDEEGYKAAKKTAISVIAKTKGPQ